MTSKLKRFLASACSVLLAVGAFGGCNDSDNRNNLRNSGESGNAGTTEEIDSTKTQLNVGFYYSGLGKDWIQEAKTAFEKKYQDTVFESGKKGVQVILDLDKSGLNGGSLLNTISAKADQVFFIENGELNSFVSRNLVAEITDIVKAPAVESETKTIEEKLDANSLDYYNMNGKYYGLPYYEDFVGMNYNIDLFEEKNYYFREGATAEGFDFENGDLNSLFVTSSSDKKSAGPDGEEGTDDDGLPATYADFRALLIRISTYGDIPMIWNGSYLTYLVDFMNSVWADFEGAENFNLNYNMDGQGTASDLIDVSANGTVTKREAIKISGDTAYMLQKQEGKYRALQFAQMCVADSTNYYIDSFSGTLTHLDAQGFFVNGSPNGDIAILIDGNWWDVEASSKFDSDPASPNSKQNKHFGSMPVPKADSSKIGEKRTLFSVNKSMCFINANTSKELMPVAKAFLSFCQSDECINIFCRNTNMMRPMTYVLTEDTLNAMSTYGRQMWTLHTSEDVVFVNDFPKSKAAVSNSNLLSAKTWGWTTSDGFVNPFIAFKNNADLTPATYFNNMYNTYVTSWGQKWVR